MLQSKKYSIGFILSLLLCTNSFAQDKLSYKNGIALSPPLPGIVVLEYERFLTNYSEPNTWTVGLSTGFGYPVNVDWVKGIEDLFETPVSFTVKWDYVFNPFVRFYFGNPEKKFRPGVMLKPSLVFFNIENEKTYLYPSYEAHFIGAFSFSKRLYANFGVGFKHFLKYGKIEHNGEETYFPAFKFQPENSNENSKRWLPAFDIAVGFRF